MRQDFRGGALYTLKTPPQNVLDRLYNKTGTDASGTGTNPPDAAIRKNVPHLLQVGVPYTLGLVVRVADVISDLGRLAAEVTNSAHGSCILSVLRP